MKFALRQILLLSICSALFLLTAFATSVVVPSDDEMVVGARAIIRGTVSSIVTRYDQQRQAVFTYITLRAHEVLKGQITSAEITLKEPGGVAGDRGTLVFGTPEFKPGENVLLFLDTWPDGSLRVYQWFLGKFNIAADSASGQVMVKREAAAVNVNVIGRSAGAITDRTDLSSYLQMLRSRVAATRQQFLRHEARFYKNVAMRAAPLEMTGPSAQTPTPNFTFINPNTPPRWFEPDSNQPVVFKVNPAGAPNAQIVGDTNAAMSAWSNVGNSSLQVINGGSTSGCGLLTVDGENTISFNNCDNYSPFSPPPGQTCSGVLAAAGIIRYSLSQTRVVNGITFYRALEANISFNPFASCYFTNSCNVREVATHEMGHALGFGHSLDTTATMYAFAHFDGRCASLRADDINGARFVYPVSSAAPLTIATSTLPNAQTGVFYSQTLVASGGSPPYAWSLIGGALSPGLNLSSGGTISGAPAAAGSFNFTVRVTDAASQTAQRALAISVTGGPAPTPTPTPTPTPPPPPGVGLQFYPLPAPVRLLDTRPGQSACNAPGAPLAGNSTITLNAHTTCFGVNIPSSAQAVAGNATVVSQSTGGSYATIYPGGQPRPTVSNLNFTPNQTIANSFAVGLGENGTFSVYTSGFTHLIIDITGYYAPPGMGGLYYHPLPRPFRLLDTRPGFSACYTPGVALAGGQSRSQQATGFCSGLNIPMNAEVIAGNATVVNQSNSAGFITLYPSGAQLPLASNLNYAAQQVLPNSFKVRLGSNGAFNIFASGSTHFIVDITGYYSSDPFDENGQGLLFYALPRPVRLLDTRPGQTACHMPGAPLSAGQSRTELAQVSCHGVTISSSSVAIFGNATAVNAGPAAGHVTLYPTGEAMPNVSNLNYVGGQIIPNSFVVRLGNIGAFDIYSVSSIHFIVDLSGYFAP